MIPQWTLAGNELSGLAALIIADGKAPGVERDSFLMGFIDRICCDRRFKTFNAIRIYLNLDEVSQTKVIDHALKHGISIVADSIDTEYKLRPKTYQTYIDNLYKHGIRLFCVDDAHRYDAEMVTNILRPIIKRRDTFVILSSGIAQADQSLSLYSILGDRLGVELQLYRSGESMIWVDRWVKKYPTMSVAALEAYKTKSGAMTTVSQIKTMGQYIVNGKVANISVYGQDENTNFDILPDHWDEVLKFVHAWHVSRGS